jgi:hypothetical protein
MPSQRCLDPPCVGSSELQSSLPHRRAAQGKQFALVLVKRRSKCKVRTLIVVMVGLLVDKDDLINYQLLIIYQLLIRTFTYQPTVDKTIVLSTNC